MFCVRKDRVNVCVIGAGLKRGPFCIELGLA